MRKNYNYDVNWVNNRNELIDCINSKCIIIGISDSVLEETQKEYKNDMKSHKFNKTVRNITGASAILTFFSPVGALIPFLIMGGTAIFSGLLASGSEFKGYAISSFTHDNRNHVFLIRYANFNDELDTINGFESLCFSQTTLCPKCHQNFKFNKKTINPVVCNKCGAKIVYYGE